MSALAACSRVRALDRRAQGSNGGLEGIRPSTVGDSRGNADSRQRLCDGQADIACSYDADAHGHVLFCAPIYAFGVPGRAPSCCMREKRLATPQCSVILPSRTRITSTVSNWILRPVGAMPKNSPLCVPW